MGFKYETGLFIDGRLTAARSGKTFDVQNPATGNVEAQMPVAGEADVDAAVEAASRAQPAWVQESAAVKAAVVRKFADLMEENAAQISELDRVCMGKPVSASLSEVAGAARLTRFVAGQVESLYGHTSLSVPNHLNLSLRQPFGVVAAIVPWNFPTQIFCHEVPAACGAGNAIILKTSEKSPLGGVLLAQLALKAGFPPGIVNVISGAGETGELLASHMKIRKIGFTGSVRAGRAVMQAAAKSNLKVVNLELGGKSPIIVFDDADLESAAELATTSITFNSGQICTASSRIYVHISVAARFKELLVQRFKALKQGDPARADTDLGPQADTTQADNVARFLDIGQQQANVLVGGGRSEAGQNYITPTIFDNVASTGTLNVEEIFGPVLVVHTFTTAQEAIQLANDTEYGLYASVFSANVDRALVVARALEAGNIGVNCTSPFDAFELPFGGYKQSGIGKVKGSNAVLDWTEEKSIYVRHKPIA